ncbi:hypothetical protein [Dactylosporangium sp. CA-092794]|uniref:hypothetical protein n=1 Tax=Dactylosporangium sp. CA-092794 TaxID=3239929 RepID=UPI003D8B60D2
MPAKDPDERRLIATVAAHAGWAQTTDRTARTEASRAVQWRKFLDEVDPDRVLDPDERDRRALSARKAYYARLRLRAYQARARRDYAAMAELLDEPPAPFTGTGEARAS